MTVRVTGHPPTVRPCSRTIGAEPTPVENPTLEGLQTDREEIVGDLQEPILGDLVETELGRGRTSRAHKLETLLALADRIGLPDEITPSPLEQTRQEAENGLERAQEETAI